jgi:lactate dehydrogenase-like 2-hydroxyacid dehydrogenase
VELAGKTLGILGFGVIGRRVARIAHFGFGMRVLAADCRPVREMEEQEGKSIEAVKADLGVDLYTCDLEPVLRESDILSIHLPATEKTGDFINADRISLLKTGALVVNTARGAVVDENALFEALSDGRLGGAALDVFQNEPYQPMTPEKDLRTLPNVVLTPHVASNTREANDRMAKACLDNIANFFNGHIDRLTRVDIASG